MTEIEQQAREWLRAFNSGEGSVEVVQIPNLEERRAFARSKGWISEGNGFGISDKGMKEVINA